MARRILIETDKSIIMVRGFDNNGAAAGWDEVTWKWGEVAWARCLVA